MKTRRHDSSTATPLELREFLCFAVYSANHAFNRVYQPLLGDLDLTYPQFIALVLLWEQDGQTVGELGQKLFLQSNTLTPMLKRLETLGYVKRSRDASARRPVCRTSKSKHSCWTSTPCGNRSKARLRAEAMRLPTPDRGSRRRG